MPGMLSSSEVMISEKARPIQSLAGSAPRFSKRRMAIRSTAGRRNSRRQAVEVTMAIAKTMRACLEDTRLQREQVLKLFRVPQSRELRVGLQLLSLLETFFQSFPQVLQGQLVAA